MGFGGIAAAVLGAAWATALTYWDVTRRRLPNPLTVPPALAGVVAAALWPAVLPGLVWPAIYMLGGRGIGGGDVKLAVPLGVCCAAAGGMTAVLAAVAAAGLCTLALGAASRAQAVAHGPSMLAAAALVVAAWGVPGAGA